MIKSCNEIELANSGVCSLVPMLQSTAEFWLQLSAVSGLTLLSQEEFCEVVNEKRDELAVAGTIDLDKQKLKLWLGDYRPITVPLSIFTPSNISPDFTRFAIIDFGHAVQFGEYEAATDYILSKCGDMKFEKLFKPPGPSSYEPKVPKPIPSPLKGIREKGSSSYDASGRRNVG